MPIAINGIFENGQVHLIGAAPTKEKVLVTVTFSDIDSALQKNEIRFGSLAGKISLPENFDDELDDLKEYK